MNDFHFLLYIIILLVPLKYVCLVYNNKRWNITKKGEKQLLYHLEYNNGSMSFRKKRLFLISINKLLFAKNIYKKRYKKEKNKRVLYFSKMNLNDNMDGNLNVNMIVNKNGDRNTYDEYYVTYLKQKVVDSNLLQQIHREEDYTKKNDIKTSETTNSDTENMIKINVGKEEKELFDILKSVNEEYKLKSTLRVVGGWVRDKHLNIINNDIDITIDNMKGAEFCEYIKKYIEEKKKHHFKFHIIKINTEQSKHLETSSFNLFNFQVDIVNLRNEKYTENSRIPEIVIGTPEEDAYRRDFTVNSLFYNLQNQRIEDFTKKGILHLKHKIICTPLEPLATFLDDPLRIIRCIRFCGFFDFALEKSIFEILKNEQIKEAFAKKISKSRLSAEIIKVFSPQCKNIVFCLTLLNYSSYSSLIFQLPEKWFVRNKETFDSDADADADIVVDTEACDNADADALLKNGIKKRKGNNHDDKNDKHNGNDKTELMAPCEQYGVVEKGKEVEANNNKKIHVDERRHIWKKTKTKDTQKEHNAKWMFDGLQYIAFFKENEKNILKEYFPNLEYKDSAYFLNLCIFFLPLHNSFHYTKKSKTEYVIEYIVRESMKFPVKYAKFCTYIFDGFIPLRNLYKNERLISFLKEEEETHKENEKEKRVEDKEEKEKEMLTRREIIADVVMFLKKVGDKWDMLLFVFYIFRKYNETTNTSLGHRSNRQDNHPKNPNGNLKKKSSEHTDTYIDADTATSRDAVNVGSYTMHLSQFSWKLYRFIRKNNLENCYKIKPFLKWTDIQSHFPKFPLNQINEVYEQIVRYMLIYGENKDSCVAYLKKYFEKYTH